MTRDERLRWELRYGEGLARDVAADIGTRGWAGLARDLTEWADRVNACLLYLPDLLSAPPSAGAPAATAATTEGTKDYAPCHGCFWYWGKHAPGCYRRPRGRVRAGETCSDLRSIPTHPADCPACRPTVRARPDLDTCQHGLRTSDCEWCQFSGMGRPAAPPDAGGGHTHPWTDDEWGAGLNKVSGCPACYRPALVPDPTTTQLTQHPPKREE